MWELDHKEGCVLKNWCVLIVVLKETLESHLDCKEIKTVDSKGHQPWRLIGKTDAEVKAPILWPSDAKSQLIGKDPNAGKDKAHKEKGATENEMVGWNHWLNGHEFEQVPGDSEGQGSLACCSHRGCEELDLTERLNINNKILWVTLTVQSLSRVRLCDPMNRSTPGLPVHHQLLNVVYNSLKIRLITYVCSKMSHSCSYC